MTRTLVLCAWLVASSALLVSCGTDPETGPSPPDTTRPVVNYVSMSDGEIDAGLVDRIVVTFSEKMDASTITPSTMFVSGRAPKGYIDYDDASRTATFTPDTLYAAETWHMFVVGDSITDLAGNSVVPDTTVFRTASFDVWNHIDDHFEPNDYASLAAPVELDTWHRTLTVGPGHSCRDFYRFSSGETLTVCIRANIRHAEHGEGWVLGFYDDEGSSHMESEMEITPGCSTSLTCTLPPGTHLAGARRDSTYGYVLYDLMVGAPDAATDRLRAAAPAVRTR